MSLRKKSPLFSFFGKTFLAALLSLTLSACVPGAGPGASPGGGIANPLSGGNLLGGGGGENAATGDSSKSGDPSNSGDPSKTDDPSSKGDGTTNNDVPGGGEEHTEAVAYVHHGTSGNTVFASSGTQNPLNYVNPGSCFPDPCPSVYGITSSVVFTPVSADDICVISTEGESGKRIKVHFKIKLYSTPPGNPIGQRLRIVNKKDHDFLDTRKTHQCGVDGIGYPVGCVKFTLTTFTHFSLQIYSVPDNASNPHNVEIPCGEDDSCHPSNPFKKDYFTTDYDFHLSDLAAHASPCASDGPEDND